jgi:hypothetical protein
MYTVMGIFLSFASSETADAISSAENGVILGISPELVESSVSLSASDFWTSLPSINVLHT